MWLPPPKAYRTKTGNPRSGFIGAGKREESLFLFVFVLISLTYETPRGARVRASPCARRARGRKGVPFLSSLAWGVGERDAAMQHTVLVGQEQRRAVRENRSRLWCGGSLGWMGLGAEGNEAAWVWDTPDSGERGIRERDVRGRKRVRDTRARLPSPTQK